MSRGDPVAILLVEDDASHAEIVRRNLGALPQASRLVHVEDGQAALDYLDRAVAGHDPAGTPFPQLILLDLRLPRVDGLEVLERLKANPATRPLPVVVLTTSEADRDLRAAYARGAGSYLVKPADFDEFVALLRQFGDYWLNCNRFPSE